MIKGKWKVFDFDGEDVVKFDVLCEGGYGKDDWVVFCCVLVDVYSKFRKKKS